MSETNRGREVRINLNVVGIICNTGDVFLSAGTPWEKVQGILQDKFGEKYQNELREAMERLRRERKIK